EGREYAGKSNDDKAAHVAIIPLKIGEAPRRTTTPSDFHQPQTDLEGVINPSHDGRVDYTEALYVPLAVYGSDLAEMDLRRYRQAIGLGWHDGHSDGGGRDPGREGRHYGAGAVTIHD